MLLWDNCWTDLNKIGCIGERKLNSSDLKKQISNLWCGIFLRLPNTEKLKNNEAQILQIHNSASKIDIILLQTASVRAMRTHLIYQFTTLQFTMNHYSVYEGFCKSPTHKLVLYFRVVYNTSILSTLEVLLGALYRIVISSLLPS